MAGKDTDNKIINFWTLNQKIEELEKKSIKDHAEIETTLKVFKEFQQQSHTDKEKIFTRIENIEKSVSDLSQSVTLFISSQEKTTKKQNDDIKEQNVRIEKYVKDGNKKFLKIVMWVAAFVLVSLVTGSYRNESKMDSMLANAHKVIIKEIKGEYKQDIKEIKEQLNKIIEDKNKDKIQIEVIKTKLNNKGK